MAAGCVPVLSAGSGAADYAVDGANARLVDARDVAAARRRASRGDAASRRRAQVAAAVRGLVDDRAARLRLRAAGVATAAAHDVAAAGAEFLGVLRARFEFGGDARR